MHVCILLLIAAVLPARTITTGRLSCEVKNEIGSTVLTIREKDGQSTAELRIHWFTGEESPENFKSEEKADTSIVSTHLLGKTTVTRTIVASRESDCVFIHVIADQPGAVHFTARFVSEASVEIRDRRQLILSEKDAQAQAWILPFESDVTNDGKSTISLAGEGEALIILNFTEDPGKHPIVDSLSRLGKKYDPDHTPPSPNLIWEGVLAEMADKETN